MSDVIDRPLLEEEVTASARLRIIDCDIHPSLHSVSDLNQFLPKRWQDASVALGTTIVVSTIRWVTGSHALGAHASSKLPRACIKAPVGSCWNSLPVGPI